MIIVQSCLSFFFHSNVPAWFARDADATLMAMPKRRAHNCHQSSNPRMRLTSARLFEAETTVLRREVTELVRERTNLGAEVASSRRSRRLHDGSSSSNAASFAADGEHRCGQGPDAGTDGTGEALQLPNDAGALESQPSDAHMLAASPATKPEQTVLQPEGGPRCT